MRSPRWGRGAAPKAGALRSLSCFSSRIPPGINLFCPRLRPPGMTTTRLRGQKSHPRVLGTRGPTLMEPSTKANLWQGLNSVSLCPRVSAAPVTTADLYGTRTEEGKVIPCSERGGRLADGCRQMSRGRTSHSAGWQGLHTAPGAAVGFAGLGSARAEQESLYAPAHAQGIRGDFVCTSSLLARIHLQGNLNKSANVFLLVKFFSIFAFRCDCALLSVLLMLFCKRCSG